MIVSTGTKTLQDQLFERDLPLVRDALALAGDGRAAQGPRELRVPPPPRAHVARGPLAVARRRARTCTKIERFARAHDARRPRRARRRARERADLAARHFDARELPRLECAHYDDCFVMKARKDALEADVVVVNHHLFFADVMLRDEGVGRAPARVQHGRSSTRRTSCPRRRRCSSASSVDRGQLAELARDARDRRAHDALATCRDCPTLRADIAPAIRGSRLAAGDAARQASARRRAPARRLRVGARRSRRGLDRARDRACALRRAQRGPRERRVARGRGVARASRAGATPPTRPTSGRALGPLARRHAGRASSCTPRRSRSRTSSAARSTRPRARGSSRRRRSPSPATSATTRASSGSTRRATGALGQPVRLRGAGAALRAARLARAEHARRTPTR